jgi:hypothetical protein
VLPPSIHKRRNGPIAQIIKPPARKDKATISKIRDDGREIQLAVEPRFDRVVIRRGDVSQMRGH